MRTLSNNNERVVLRNDGIAEFYDFSTYKKKFYYYTEVEANKVYCWPCKTEKEDNYDFDEPINLEIYLEEYERYE